MRTSEILIDYCNDDILPLDRPAVICDYFGMNNFKHIPLIFAVYQMIVRYANITENDLHTALITNKLNELIHNNYSKMNVNNNYYNQFCKLNIKVGTPL